jgi:hypothetical protein
MDRQALQIVIHQALGNLQVNFAEPKRPSTRKARAAINATY